jgi:vancomycin resistance protein YoaR
VVVSRWRIGVLVALVVPLVVAGGTTTAWAIDTHGDHSVRRGVELAGHDVGGSNRPELDRQLDHMVAQFAKVPVTVNGGDLKLDTTAQALGLHVDRAATAAAVMAAGRHDAGPLGPFRWMKAVLVGRPVQAHLTLDRATAVRKLEALEGDHLSPAVEPSLHVVDGEVRVVPGRPGGGLDLDAALAKLPTAVEDLSRPIIVATDRHDIEPQISDAAVRKLADRANAVTKAKVDLKVGDQTQSIDGGALRPGFAMSVVGGVPTLTLDPDLVARLLVATSQNASNPTGVKFMLVDGRMTAVAGHDAVVCCGDEAPQKIVDGLLAGMTTIDVPTRTVTAAQGVQLAAQLGVKEVVGAFTTHHAAGQPRVKNIHRMADLVRGTLIAPGQTFSVNDFVGRRTTEKGFVSAPVIDEGKFSTDVGGGVSQFATTLFNAAFFAGLDIPDHKAHSIYISRYPFGREATLAYPSVDLKIHNNTPYGVVIWPTYTGSSLTVQLWSTRFVAGAQTGGNKTSGCGRVTVERTRLFVDGHSDKQTYNANYNCHPPKE